MLCGQGTFGWVLATNSETTLATAKGRAYGDKMDSYRSEAYGMLSLLCYINHLFSFYNTPLPASLNIEVFSDNKALTGRVNDILHQPHPLFTNQTLTPSYDLMQAIITKCRCLPGITVDWVKGHRDRDVSAAQMKPQERLNVIADALAGEFQSQTNHKHRSAPMIGGSRVQLRIRNQTVHSSFRRALRARRPAKILRAYIQRKTGMTDNAFDDVDWDTHKIACNNYQRKGRFLSKFLHYCLPVGRTVHRYDPFKYPSNCPSCNEPNEDQTHWLRCQDPERRKWRDRLRTDLRKLWVINRDDPVLEDIMDKAIYHWWEGTPFPAQEFPNHRRLIDSQAAIGWDQLLYSRFSKYWNICQYDHLLAHGKKIDSYSQGPSWLVQFINTTWHCVQEEWDVRNKARHGESSEEQAAIKLATIKRQIAHLYTRKRNCLPIDRDRLFYSTAEEHFEKHPSYTALNAWYALNRALIHVSCKNMERNENAGQTLITSFFRAGARAMGSGTTVTP